jgi:hypothetical protein
VRGNLSKRNNKEIGHMRKESYVAIQQREKDQQKEKRNKRQDEERKKEK